MLQSRNLSAGESRWQYFSGFANRHTRRGIPVSSRHVCRDTVRTMFPYYQSSFPHSLVVDDGAAGVSVAGAGVVVVAGGGGVVVAGSGSGSAV